jgi:hypothetical protein
MESSDVNSLSAAINALSTMESSDVNSLSAAINALSTMESSDVNSLSIAIAALQGAAAPTLVQGNGVAAAVSAGFTKGEQYIFLVAGSQNAAPATFTIPGGLGNTDDNPIAGVKNTSQPDDVNLDFGRLDVAGYGVLSPGESMKIIKGVMFMGI